MRKQNVVHTGDLRKPLRLTRAQERELFRRMSRGGLIARVRPGLYLVPRRLPLGGPGSPDEGLALKTLMEDRDGRYQICGPNAFHRYGFADQVPTQVYVYNNRISGDRTVGAVALTLIRVADERLGDTEEKGTVDGLTVTYSFALPHLRRSPWSTHGAVASRRRRSQWGPLGRVGRWAASRPTARL